MKRVESQPTELITYSYKKRAVTQHSFLLRTSACRLDLDQTSRHLYGLQFADGRSECRAFVRVVRSAVQRSLSDAESLSGDPDPSAVQGLLREADKQRVYTPQVVNQKLILEAWPSYFNCVVDKRSFFSSPCCRVGGEDKIWTLQEQLSLFFATVKPTFSDS